MPLARLMYYSENQLDPKRGPLLHQLSAILKVSQRNNAAAGITGALVFDDLWFIQALEGERTQILKTFDRLKNDERHAAISLVHLSDIEDRVFGNWWMGLATRNEATLKAFKPYLTNGRLRPDEMTGQQMLAFIAEVAELGLSRDVMINAA